MTFASLEFLVLLALSLSLYYFLPRRGRQLLLLFTSYVFYAYWKPFYALLIFASTLLDYAMARTIPRCTTAAGRRMALSASVLGNLGMLAYFKYTNFALDSLRALLGPLGATLPGPLELILPVGISFYTFQTMSYTIDVYRGDQKPERDFVLVALYVSFFPQLVAGPIERARELMPQLAVRQPFSFRNLEEGTALILWGFVKKIVVSDRLVAAGYPAFLDPAAYSTGELVFAAMAGVVFIYLDFSAYSDIAKGTAQLFGVRLTQNFRYPHAAANYAEFWRRWHVSMSSWVRDYLFRPLGGFRPRNRLADARITLTTMALVGLWHGASWTFVTWGTLNGLMLVLYRVLRLTVLRRFKNSALLRSVPWRFGSWLFVLAIRVTINVLFFAPTFGDAMTFWKRLYVEPTSAGFGRPYVWIGIATIFAFWSFHYVQSLGRIGPWFERRSPWLRGAAYAALFYLVFFGSVDQAEQFIYFQF